MIYSYGSLFSPKVLFILSCLAALSLTFGELRSQTPTPPAPLPELEKLQAAKTMPVDSLVFKETYGKGNGGVMATDFFDVLSSLGGSNAGKGSVVNNELVLEVASGGSGAIVGYDPKINFPLTMDLKMRVEFEGGGGVQFVFCINRMYTAASLTASGMSANGATISFDPAAVHTYRFVFDKNISGRVYVLDAGASVPLVPHFVDTEGIDIRFSKAKLYIQEVDLYDRMP